jgi:hypothetical protein
VKLQAAYTKANIMETEQEALKAQAKVKTEELRLEMDGIDESMPKIETAL